MTSAPDPRPATLDCAAVRAEIEEARLDFHRLLDVATPADLRQPSDGTRWTNQQLLFHMLLGYLVVRTLLVLVRALGMLPDRGSKAFAGLLNSVRRPFDLVNYLGSCAGARIIPPARMAGVLDHVTGALQRRLQLETYATLDRGMRFPASWDPLFSSYMTLAELYRYPTQHYRYHRQQLTLLRPSATGPVRRARRPGRGGCDPAADNKGIRHSLTMTTRSRPAPSRT